MAAGDLKAPIIPLLIEGTIDPEALNGGPLKTYAKYSDPDLGDILYQSWLGLDENGNPIDVKDIPIFIDPDDEEDLGFLMEITNKYVNDLNNGQVFYSYFLERKGLPPKEESKRIHFGIGKHGLVSAPQIKESHDLQLDPDAIEDQLMTISVVPQTAMSNGDSVKVYWEGKFEDGTVGPPVTLPAKTLNDRDTDWTNNPQEVLSWTVPRANVAVLEGGMITLHYEITYASPAAQATTKSAQRSILVTPPAAAELLVPTVKDLDGTEINPGQFLEGIQVVIPPYQGIRVGDEVLVYGTRIGVTANSPKNTIQYLKVDRSHIDSGRIEVPIAAKWLLDNVGAGSGGTPQKPDNVTLRYQYARADAAGSSASLALSIRQPLVLPAPTVDHSTDKGDQLDPIRAICGAFIAIPETATIGGEEVTAYWNGFGPDGSFETTVPSQRDPMKFKVPADKLPANFGKTVEVTYKVAGQYAQPSLQLFINQLTNHPVILCDKAEGGSPPTLRRSHIPAEGALLTVEPWSFISTRHKVRLWLTARGISDLDIIAVRNVELEETTGGVKARLFETALSGIATGDTLTLRASVSFDDGHSTLLFNQPLTLKLLD
ncbi:hypothetical protein [Pseudomonas silesiensis]